MKGFIIFIREQGVIGLAVGFILGGAISKLVASLVSDIINPALGVVLGSVGSLSDSSLRVGTTNIMYGNFITVFIDFITIALVVYVGVKLLKLEKLDKKK